jgi:DNA-binding HxlR family transcriptional regulator
MKKTKCVQKSGCPVDNFQQMISGKYKLKIIWNLQQGPTRYGQIKAGLLRGNAEVQEIPARVLSRELKALAEKGMIHRKDYKVVPPKVEYTLTDLGRSLIPVIATMHQWAVRNFTPPGVPKNAK